MTHSDIIELLGAYALDAVEPDEEGSISAHLRTCVECSDEVNAFREVAALLTAARHDSPDGGWERLVTSIEERSPTEIAAIPRWVRPALAAAAVTVVALGAFSMIQRGQVARLTERVTVAEAELTAAKPPADVQAVLAATMQQPSSTFVNLAGEGATEVLVVLSSDGTGYVARHNLPALTDGRTYQLWAVIDDRVISAGVLGPDPDVVPFRVDTPGLQGFAITAETSGGVAVSSEQPVAAWLKDA